MKLVDAPLGLPLILESDGDRLLARLARADRLAREVREAFATGDRPRRIVASAMELAGEVLGRPPDDWPDPSLWGGGEP